MRHQDWAVIVSTIWLCLDCPTPLVFNRVEAWKPSRDLDQHVWLQSFILSLPVVASCCHRLLPQSVVTVCCRCLLPLSVASCPAPSRVLESLLGAPPHALPFLPAMALSRLTLTSIQPRTTSVTRDIWPVIPTPTIIPPRALHLLSTTTISVQPQTASASRAIWPTPAPTPMTFLWTTLMR